MTDQLEPSRLPTKVVVLSLCLILLLGTTMRFFELSETPPGLMRDEVSTAYDAYSILETGRDQHGALLPLFARSRGDYNEAIYRYLAIPGIAALGLTEFAARLPAALLGSLSLLLMFLLGRDLFGPRVALFQTLILAISPWHIQYSRVAFRAICFPFFFLLWMLLFQRGLRRPEWLPVAGCAFVLTAYTYSSSRVFSPLLWILLLVVYRRELRLLPRRFSLSFLAISLGGLAGLGLFWISPQGMARADGLVLHEPAQWVWNYLSYFDPRFLFFPSDQRFLTLTTGFGLFYWPLMLLLLCAGVQLVRQCRAGRGQLAAVVLAALLLYPIPAALTAPQEARRAIIASVIFPFIAGFGLEALGQLVHNLRVRRLVWTGTVFTLLSMFALFSTRYLSLYRDASWFHWDHGWQEVIAFCEGGEYDLVYISNDYLVPHMFILFYTAYPPAAYQKNPALMHGSNHVERLTLDQYRIGPLDEIPFTHQGPMLVVLRPQEVQLVDPELQLEVVKLIRSPIGYVPFVLLEPRADATRGGRRVEPHPRT